MIAKTNIDERQHVDQRDNTNESKAPKHMLRYNAEVVDWRLVHDELAVLRVRPDGGVPEFRAGQYTTLGLWDSESTLPNADDDGPAHEQGTSQEPHMIRRPYSISSPIVDADNCVRPARSFSYLEFFVALVRHHVAHRAALTPRMFALERGSRLFCDDRCRGSYTLDAVKPTDDVVLLATGTGEAPHNAMVGDLLAADHQGSIVTVTCVRNRRDLGYENIHRSIAKRFANYQYVTLTTREPENIDRQRPDFVGKQYVQDFIISGALEACFDGGIDPARTHVFVCGSPQMIGRPHRDADNRLIYSQPRGAVEVLVDLGFTIDEPKHPGNLHLESYW